MATISRQDDFAALAMPLQELRRSRPEFNKAAGLAIVELQDAWARAGWERADSFEYEPSRIARPAWEQVSIS